jgi:DNA polymerase III subunit delta'
MNQVADYLANYQTPIHALFSRAIKQKRWSHAYLLDGRDGQPLLSIATWLAQSLLCENPSPLACDICLTCQRVIAKDYTDIIVFDGSESSIKKLDVLSIASRFAITGLEKANKQIYVLHLVEFMTPEAINALLKFLEEPQQEIYAIMTTENLANVLPTIQSRSQVVHLKPMDQERLILEATSKQVNELDAQFLSFECGTFDAIVSMSQTEEYQHYQTHLTTFTKQWITDVAAAHDYFRQNWLPSLLEVNLARQWIKRWIFIISEMNKITTKQAVILKGYGSMLMGIASRIPQPYAVVNRLQKRLYSLDKSTNLSLFLEATMIELLGVIS